MKKIMFFPIAVVLALGVFMACKKSTKNSEASQKNLIDNQVSGELEGVKNSNNQYDFVGVLHNEGLDNFIENYKSVPNLKTGAKSCDFSKMMEMNRVFLSQNDPTLSSMLSQDAFRVNFKTFVLGSTSGKSNVEIVQSLDVLSVPISPSFKAKLLDLINTVDNIDFKDRTSLLNYFHTVKLKEENIKLDQSLTQEEIGMLLASASVARYSALYWFDVISGNDGRWSYGQAPMETMDGKTIIKWDLAAGAGGAATGAMIGGTVTIPAGGIGALPGWLAGAIIGAVGGSVTEGVYEALDWLFG